MKKRTVIFLHDILGTSADLKDLMELVKARGNEVLTFDFAGHGTSTAMPDHFRVDSFAHELDAFIQKHHLSKVAVFGHSLGGYVALYHRVNFEDSPITQVFTYGTKFNWRPEVVAKELPQLNPDTLGQYFPEEARILAEKHGERWKHLLRCTAHLYQNLEKVDGLTKEDLLEIEIPVILMLGDQDRWVTSEETNNTKARMAKAQVKTISHSKHDLPRSNLKEISQVILGALD